MLVFGASHRPSKRAAIAEPTRHDLHPRMIGLVFGVRIAESHVSMSAGSPSAGEFVFHYVSDVSQVPREILGQVHNTEIQSVAFEDAAGRGRQDAASLQFSQFS